MYQATGLADESDGLVFCRLNLARVALEFERQVPSAPTPTLARKRGRERLMVLDDGAGGREVLMGKLEPDRERRRGRFEVSEQGRFHFGSRLDFEVHLGDHPQRAEGTDVQFHQVVARDVLHHLAARTCDLARRVGDGNADHPVAHRAIAASAEPVAVGRDHAADGRSFRMRWIEREALALLAQRGLQVAQPYARLDAAGEVRRLVLEQPCHPFGGKRHLVTPWRSAQPHLRATAPDHHGGRRQVAEM